MILKLFIYHLKHENKYSGLEITVRCKTIKKKFKMPFYRPNAINFYNHNMGNVDLNDQLQNHLRYDSNWHINRKCWWDILWWGFQVQLTNYYVCYLNFKRMLHNKRIVTQYEYNPEIEIDWIEPKLYWPKKLVVYTCSK